MKPGLVLLPGMMCDARLFEPQIAHFEQRFDLHVASLADGDTMEALVEAALKRIRFERFSLAGLSMGGIAAMEMMSQAPARIERVIILDSNHLADTAERRTIRERQIADVRAGHLRQIIVKEMKPHYLAEGNRGDHGLLDQLVEMAMDLGEEVFIAQSRALMTRRDYSDVLSRWPQPVLLLCGAEDALCPPARHQAMAGLLKAATLHVVHGAGHISTLEQADSVTRLMDEFLTSI
ncbi:alpha/beta fold hydrolase [Pelagibius sp. Alg239-R121]|uniref:alpha/beta fold hydrolase n=1 Tax=Pelagibius sp. Alg239-R121 TaxID=2993448 RepID=UPI0024A6C6FD|nr:alpha/beta fold hydrolase [Pelagibius sp. Alg239-R121]